MMYQGMTREQLLAELKKAKDEVTQLRWSLGTRELRTTSGVFPGMVSERRYRGLFENSPVAFWEEDLSKVKGYLDRLRKSGVKDFRDYFNAYPDEALKCNNFVKIIDVNQATVDLYHAGTKKEFGAGLNDFLPEEARNVIKEKFIALADGKIEFSSELIQRKFTGQKFETILKLAIAPGHEYDWTRVLVTIIDITERKQFEEEIRTRQEQYELVVAGANDGLWDWDIANKNIYFSPRWKAMIGYSEDEFPNSFTAFEMTLHPDDHDSTMQGLMDYLKGKTPIFEIEYRFRHKNGSYRWILARGAALWDEAGKPIRMAGSHMDISKRKETEQLLSRKAKQLSTVAEISTKISTLLEIDQMMQTVVDLTRDQFNLYHSQIYLFNQDEYKLELLYGSGEIGKHMVSEKRSIPFEDEKSLIARVARTRNGIISNNLRQDPDYSPHPLLAETKSELTVPVIVGSELLGVLDVQSEITDRFSPEDVQIFTTLAAQIAVALQNARQYAEILESRKKLSEALKIADLCNWKINFSNWVLELDDQFFALHRDSQDENIVYNLKFEDYLEQYIHPENQLDFRRELEKVESSGDADYSSEFDVRMVDGQGVDHYITIRVRAVTDVRERIIGAYGVIQDLTERRKAEEIIAKRAAELATVAEVSTSVSTILKPDLMLQSVVDLVKERFGLYHAHVYLMDEMQEMLQLTSSADEIGRRMVSEEQIISIDAKRSLVAQAARTKESLIVNNLKQDSEFLPHPLLPETTSEMAVPMVVGDQVVGVLDVQSDKVNSFSDEDASIFTTLASQVAVALQNARLYAQKQKQANQEALINSISARIQSTTSVENALQVTVRELGNLLGAEKTSIQLRVEDQA